MSDFMNSLTSKLIEEKKVAKSTAEGYVRSLYSLNGKKEFKNLSWLKRTADVLEYIKSNYAESTQRTLLATLVSVTSIAGPSYKKALKVYSDAMGVAIEEHKSEPKGVKTEKQKDAWMDWSEVKEKHESMIKEVASYTKKKSLTEAEWNNLLSLLVLSLYVYSPPRRNADYQLMYISALKKSPEDTTKNWLDLTSKKFIFNVYKTAKKYGAQTEDVPPELLNVITLYLKFHPGWNKETKKTTTTPLLVNYDGANFTTSNAITRILNKIFNKRVGASMLRHIFLTSKYGAEDKERSDDAEKMGHSVEQQKGYILRDAEPDKVVIG